MTVNRRLRVVGDGGNLSSAGPVCGSRGHRGPTANAASVGGVPKVYAIANQKGGVGKTTTAVNVGACIAEAGYATLLVDVDPQANATVGLGIAADARARALRGARRAMHRRSRR